MAVTVYGVVSSSASGTVNLTLAVDATVKAVVLLGASQDNLAPFSGTPTYGGVNLTQIEAPQGWAFELTEIWALLDLSACVGDTLSFVHANTARHGVGVAVSAAATLVVADSAQDADIVTTQTITLDPSPETSALGLAVCCAAGALTDDGGQTGLYGNAGSVTGSVSSKAFGSSPDSLSFTKTGGAAGMPISGILLSESITAFSPTPFGVEVGFQAGLAFSVPSDVTLYAPPIYGVEVGFQAGVRLDAAGPRQVMLVGEGIETPWMTEGGTEGQVLTYHEDAQPDWQDGGGVDAADLAALGVVGPILIADVHSTPLVFDDLLQNDDGDDLLYADLGA